jgi:hypothetical protein
MREVAGSIPASSIRWLFFITVVIVDLGLLMYFFLVHVDEKVEAKSEASNEAKSSSLTATQKPR